MLSVTVLRFEQDNLKEKIHKAIDERKPQELYTLLGMERAREEAIKILLECDSKIEMRDRFSAIADAAYSKWEVGFKNNDEARVYWLYVYEYCIERIGELIP